MNHFGAHNAEAIRKMPSYHVIVLAKNDIGRVNLYTLISKSHLEYFGRQPRMPKSEIMKLLGISQESVYDNVIQQGISDLVQLYYGYEI